MGFKLFKSSKSKAPKDRKVPENSLTTIRKIKDNLEVQEKREEYIQTKIKKLELEAKTKMRKGDKRGALFAMKKRKLHEGELTKIENVKMTLETQIINLEGATQNVETMNAMTHGTSAMKSIRKMFGVDKVDSIMDDVRDEMDMHRDVEDAFSRPIDPLMAADDDDLLAELEALDTSDFKQSMSLWPSTPAKRPTSNSTASQQQQQPVAVAEKKKFALFG